MGCCGQKRALLRNTSASTAPPARPAAPVPAGPTRLPPANASAWVTPAGTVVLRYLERAPIVVRGSVTGRRYHFSAGSPLLLVDRRDAEALLRTRFFQLS